MNRAERRLLREQNELLKQSLNPTTLVPVTAESVVPEVFFEIRDSLQRIEERLTKLETPTPPETGKKKG